MKLHRILLLALLLAPLVVGAETIEWVLPTTYTDGSTISATDKARITVYLRGYKSGSPTAKTYFGETRGGLTTWGVAGDNTYIMNKMNEWAATNAVAGWVNIVPGDTVYITTSAAITWTANGIENEYDGPESAPYAWTIYKTPPPPAPTPSCNPPSGLKVKP